MARAVVKSKIAKTIKTAVKEKKGVVPAKELAAKKVTKASPKVAVQAIAAESKKKLSDKLIETIEKRKEQQNQKSPFGKPMGRRGRRPKSMTDYQPYSEEQQEDSYVLESENERLEYDTGIRVGGGAGASTGGGAGASTSREDSGFSLDRSEDFDEELNFDW